MLIAAASEVCLYERMKNCKPVCARPRGCLCALTRARLYVAIRVSRSAYVCDYGLFCSKLAALY
jgi:hypothetical protein